MSFTRKRIRRTDQFCAVRDSFLQEEGLAFSDTLTEGDLTQACHDHQLDFGCDDDDVYTPAVTLWAFLSQVLFLEQQRSCAAAVARVVVMYIALGRQPPSINTGAYCRARSKLSEPFLRQLSCDVARRCERELSEERLWYGRHVYLADGTTVSMPDTEANQAMYPQAKSQAQGVGFPIARMVVLLSLATAMVCEMAIGPYAGKETGETALLRQLLGKLTEGDILLADGFYCSYFMLAILKKQQVDAVMRIHHKRKVDFLTGRVIKKRDHVTTWHKPSQCPIWMDKQTYLEIPEILEVRETEVVVEQAGFRPQSFVIISTLLNGKTYSAEALGDLYRDRWNAELDIFAIKITMGMDVLRCKTPEMVHKEIWACLLAYNLIRRSMLQAAAASGRSVRSMSFTTAVVIVTSSWTAILFANKENASSLIRIHLKNMCCTKVANRPDRFEPRATKRRPKKLTYLTKPRGEAKQELLKSKST